MSRQHTPSVDLALSLATPLPLARDTKPTAAEAPSALPEPASSERHELQDEHLGTVEEIAERFTLGEGVSLLVHWLLDPQATEATPKHVRNVELVIDGNRLPLRRGQLDALTRAIVLSEDVFETAEREELARRTC